MAYTANSNANVTGSLAADVVNTGTVTGISYPSGTTQLDFNAGLAGTPVLYINSDKQTAGAFSVAYGASTITLTNSTGSTWAAGSSYTLGLDQADGNAVQWFNFSANLADITAADIFTDVRPGVEGVIEYIQWVTTKVGAGAGAAATLTLKIGATTVAGSTLALSLANQTPAGVVLSATPTIAVPSTNTIVRASKITLTASAVTAFTGGAGFYSMRIRRNATNG